MPKQSLNDEFICAQELNQLWQSCQAHVNNSLLLREHIILYRAALIEKIKLYFHTEQRFKQFDPESMEISPSVLHGFIEHIEYHLGEFSRFFTKMLLTNDDHHFSEFDLSAGAPASIFMDWIGFVHQSHLQQCVLDETESVAISSDQSEELSDITITVQGTQWKQYLQAEQAILDRLSRLVSIAVDKLKPTFLHTGLNRLLRFEQHLSMKLNQVKRKLEHTLDVFEKKLTDVKSQAMAWNNCTQQMNEWSSQYFNNAQTISCDAIKRPELPSWPHKICTHPDIQEYPMLKGDIALYIPENMDDLSLCMFYIEQSEKTLSRCMILERKIHETNKVFFAMIHVEKELNVYYKKFVKTIIDIEPMVSEWIDWQEKMLQRSKATQPIQPTSPQSSRFDSRFFAHSPHQKMIFPDVPKTPIEIVFPKVPDTPIFIQPQHHESKTLEENGGRQYAQYI